MTITPVPVRPAASTPGARDGRSVGDPEGFATLVSRETERLVGRSGGAGSGAVGDGSGPDGGTAPASAGDVPAGVVLPGVVTTGDVGSGLSAIDPEGAGPDAGAAQEEGGTVIGNTAVDGEVAQPGGDLAGVAVTQDGDPAPGVTGDVVPRAGTGAQHTNGSTARVGEGRTSVLPGSEAVPGTPEGCAASGPVPEAGASTPAPGASTTSAGPTATAGPDLANAPVVTGTATATGAETAGGGAPTGETARTTTALLDQVSPTLTRLVSRGDGEHRMTLKIHPADLGEVHLTVTVRGDRVDVDIAASAEARELLRDGLTQLRALLDPTGRGGGQLVFRDLPTAPAGQAVSAETPTGGDPGDRSGAGDGSAERHDGRGSHPGPGAVRTGATGEPATENAVPPTPRGAAGIRSVDVTI